MPISNRHQQFILSMVDEADEIIASISRIEHIINLYFAEGFDSATVTAEDVAGNPAIGHMDQARIASMITQLQALKSTMDAAGFVTEVTKVASTEAR